VSVLSAVKLAQPLVDKAAPVDEGTDTHSRNQVITQAHNTLDTVHNNNQHKLFSVINETIHHTKHIKSFYWHNAVVNATSLCVCLNGLRSGCTIHT